jgi:hypothetical protein
MTGVAVDWATMSTPEFVGWTRMVGVGLPFPLNTGEMEWIEAPDPIAVRKILELRQLADSPILEDTAAVFARPRLAVFVIRVHLGGEDQRFVAIAGKDDDKAVLVLLDRERTTVRIVAEHELVASMVGTLPALTGYPCPTAEVTIADLQAVDQAFASGLGERERHALMVNAAFPPQLIALRERIGTKGGTTGLIGAVAFDGPDEVRAAQRSASWREYPEGALFQVEQRQRRGDRSALVGAYSPDAVFRAAADLVSDLYAGPR